MQAIGDFFSMLFSGLIDWFVNIFNTISQGAGGIVADFLKAAGLSDLSIPGNVFSILKELSIGVGYIFPVRDLLPIPLFWLSFYVARIVFSVFRLIASTVLKRIKLKIK